MYQPPPKTALVSLGASYCIRPKKFGLFVVLAATFSFIMTVVAGAAAVTQGYSAASQMPVGTLVSVSRSDPSQVEPANNNNASYMVGVVTEADSSLVAVGDPNSQVFVAINGDAEVLASSIDGEIKKGDLLGPSAISGVATKTGQQQGGRVMGVALADFDQAKAQTQTIDGQEVSIVLLPVKIVSTVVAGNSQSSKSFFQRIGLAVTGTEVSILRVVIASLLFMTTLFVSGMMLFGSIKGAFNSVGRNPLASDSIFSNLMHVTLVATTILVVGLAAAYLVMVV